MTTLYGRVLEIRAVKTSGAHKGKHYRHTFKSCKALALDAGKVQLVLRHNAVLLIDPHGDVWQDDGNPGQ